MIKKNYRLFLVSDLISQFGAGMIMAALSWFIITNNGSNQLLATTTNINIMSGLIVSIFAGTIVDRYKNKNVIISTHFIRLLLIILPVILMNSFGYNSIFLFMIALSNGIGWNLYFPASKSFIQELAEDKELIKFNSWAEITMQIGLFSSGALAGSLYKFIGFQNILIFSSLSFVVSII